MDKDTELFKVVNVETQDTLESFVVVATQKAISSRNAVQLL